ncbi:MAG: glycosyltransferase [Aeriscardovia sp.]|nr:glycosyltransferase [Aeriscardovia sp.]MBR2756240.1 glycosyltransferase [Lachnospiraceae bacterium]
MKKVSLFTPCFNEEGNILELYEAVRKVMDSMPQYEFEYVLIDNDSQDKTVSILREICEKDPRVKVIVNQKNFGPGRSGCYGFLQTTGDVSICFAADLQDPPELIPEFLEKWEQGAKVVWGRKAGDEEHGLIKLCRKAYYSIIKLFSDEEQYTNVSGFGLYDREVMDMIAEVDDPIPNFRHLIADFGYSVEFVDYVKPNRKKGKSSYNFWRYYNTAMDSLVGTSTQPLRLITLFGFILAIICFIIGLVYLILKLIFWNSFSAGLAPLLIGIFFLGAVQIFFIGILGEYLGSVLTRLKRRPMVVEKERINFEKSNTGEKES